MARKDEKLELARLVTATERLLHRVNMQRIFGGNPDSIPALTPQQFRMMMAIHDKGSMTIRQLTEALYVKAPAASIMVERLVEMGILTREENPKDRREVLVRVSPQHESEIREIERRHLQATLDLFEEIGMDYARMWGTICERIQACLEKEQTRTDACV